MKKQTILTFISLGAVITTVVIGLNKCLKKDKDISDMYFDDELTDEELYGEEVYQMYTQTNDLDNKQHEEDTIHNEKK